MLGFQESVLDRARRLIMQQFDQVGVPRSTDAIFANANVMRFNDTTLMAALDKLVEEKKLIQTGQTYQRLG